MCVSVKAPAPPPMPEPVPQPTALATPVTPITPAPQHIVESSTDAKVRAAYKSLKTIMANYWLH